MKTALMKGQLFTIGVKEQKHSEEHFFVLKDFVLEDKVKEFCDKRRLGSLNNLKLYDQEMQNFIAMLIIQGYLQPDIRVTVVLAYANDSFSHYPAPSCFIKTSGEELL